MLTTIVNLFRSWFAYQPESLACEQPSQQPALVIASIIVQPAWIVASVIGTVNPATGEPNQPAKLQ